MKRGVVAALVLAVCLVGMPGATAPCPPGEGVTVVVDASALGGEVSVSCVTGEPSDGVEALQDAGHTITATQAFSEFVCRIDGQPTAEQDPCVNTPPASAFWSYWQAARGENWSISQTSAFQSTPQTGGAEGWSFGSGDPPSVPPPSDQRTTTTTSTLSTASTAVESTSGTTSSPITTASTTTQAATTTVTADGDSDTSPGPWPTVVGLVIIGVLGSGAFIWARRSDG